jgi:hypothetical protein
MEGAMDDKQLRARIATVLDDYDRSLWRYWAQHIAVSSAAAGLALGLAACPPEWMPRGPDAGHAVSQPLLDPDVTAEYAIQPDWRREQTRVPLRDQPIPVPPYSVSVPPSPPDPMLQAEYAVAEPRPEPIVKPVSKYAVPIEHMARPAYAIEPEPMPRPDLHGVATPMYAKQVPATQPTTRPAPDVRPVARYAIRAPRTTDVD